MLDRAREPAADTDEIIERILDAALARFEGFGVRRTTMEEVARAAAVARVTIYRRFASKDALAEAVIVREARRFFDALDLAVGRRATLEERVVESFSFTLEYLRRHVLFNRLVNTEPESIVPHLTTQGEVVIATAARLVAERLGAEIREGRLPPVEVEVVSELIVRLVVSFILTPASAARLDEPANTRRFARRYLVSLLTGAPRGRSE